MRPILPPVIAAALLIALAGPAAAISFTKPGMSRTVMVPEDRGPQRVSVHTRDIEPGGEIGWHTHAGTEIAYVESGTMELRVAGSDTHRLEAGGSSEIARGLVHSGRNVGDTPVRLVVVYLLDRDAPQREPAPAPDGY